jgi:hypothetical protein
MLKRTIYGLLWLITGVIAIFFAYLTAGVIQYAIGYFMSGGADVPRMGWEKFPINLLLIPVAPVLSFEIMLQNPTAGTVQIFMLFFIPFLLILAAIAALLWRWRSKAQPATPSAKQG